MYNYSRYLIQQCTTDCTCTPSGHFALHPVTYNSSKHHATNPMGSHMAQTLWIYNCQTWALHDFVERIWLPNVASPMCFCNKRIQHSADFHLCGERNLVFLPSYRKSISSLLRKKNLFCLFWTGKASH